MNAGRRRLALAGAWLLARSARADEPPAVHDDEGHVVRLTRPARRIVALSPQLAELAWAAGAGAFLVGTVSAAVHPPAVARLPRVGDAFGLNLEALAMLRPDLVLAWSSGTPARQAAALRRLGIPVYWSETRTLQDVGTTVLRIGELAGTQAVARAWARAYADRLASLRRSQTTASPVRVFYQAWPAPLMTIGARQLIDQAITLCGGVNVFGTLAVTTAEVSREAVLARDPQLIVAATPDPRALQAWRAFPQLSAVRHGRLVLLSPDELPGMGVRVLDGVQQLCEAIQRTRRRIAR